MDRVKRRGTVKSHQNLKLWSKFSLWKIFWTLRSTWIKPNGKQNLTERPHSGNLRFSVQTTLTGWDDGVIKNMSSLQTQRWKLESSTGEGLSELWQWQTPMMVRTQTDSFRSAASSEAWGGRCARFRQRRGITGSRWCRVGTGCRSKCSGRAAPRHSRGISEPYCSGPSSTVGIETGEIELVLWTFDGGGQKNQVPVWSIYWGGCQNPGLEVRCSTRSPTNQPSGLFNQKKRILLSYL